MGIKGRENKLYHRICTKSLKRAVTINMNEDKLFKKITKHYSS